MDLCLYDLNIRSGAIEDYVIPVTPNASEYQDDGGPLVLLRHHWPENTTIVGAWCFP
jgi:hypothetical protein